MNKESYQEAFGVIAPDEGMRTRLREKTRVPYVRKWRTRYAAAAMCVMALCLGLFGNLPLGGDMQKEIWPNLTVYAGEYSATLVPDKDIVLPSGKMEAFMNKDGSQVGGIIESGGMELSFYDTEIASVTYSCTSSGKLTYSDNRQIYDILLEAQNRGIQPEDIQLANVYSFADRDVRFTVITAVVDGEIYKAIVPTSDGQSQYLTLDEKYSSFFRPKQLASEQPNIEYSYRMGFKVASPKLFTGGAVIVSLPSNDPLLEPGPPRVSWSPSDETLKSLFASGNTDITWITDTIRIDIRQKDDTRRIFELSIRFNEDGDMVTRLKLLDDDL